MFFISYSQFKFILLYTQKNNLLHPEIVETKRHVLDKFNLRKYGEKTDNFDRR